MKSIKIFLKIFVFLLLVVVLSKSWQLITEGFRLDKIKQELKFTSEKVNVDPEINKILDQQFNYLSKGCQTYVFESQDKNYVIKFVRFHRYKTPFWFDVLTFFDDYKNKRQAYKNKLLSNSLNSYEIAYKYLENETATVYVHLNKTNLINKKLIIRDRLKKKYVIDLDNTAFLVQKRVNRFKDILKKYQNNEDELKRLTHSFLLTTKSIYLKGFNNDDYNCIKNSGVIDNRVIHSDVGSFIEKNLKDKEAFEKEFKHFVIYFNKWAKKNAPFLIDYVDDEIKKMSLDLQ